MPPSQPGADTSTWQLGGYISDVYPAANRTLFERERQRVHLAAFSGDDTSVVCVRIDDDKVQAGDPGVGPAPNGGVRLVGGALWAALGPSVGALLL